MSDRTDWNVDTLLVAGGRPYDPGAPFNVPPTFASTYRDGGAIGYGRWGNPTWTALEDTVGVLEHGHAVAFASGQAGISALVADLPIGARLVLPQDAYLGTRGLFAELADRGRIELRLVDVTDTDVVLRLLPTTDLLWLESPTNPMLGVVELPRVLDEAKAAGVRTVVDNTFATPLLQQPLTLGADAVVHSATKYLGGHSDLLLGVVVTADAAARDALINRRTYDGATPGVMEAYLALRGMRTLSVRFERQQRSAMTLAQSLGDHRDVVQVHYPGLPSDPFHRRAREHMSGFGAIVSFEVADAETADAVAASLRLIVGGTSLGGVESTIDRRNRWHGEENVPPGLLRLSVGLEDADDLWSDLSAALGTAHRAST